MADFNGILKEAIDGGESLESAMRKAASLAAKEAIESLLRTEIKTILGYDRYDPSGKNSGDSRNGTYERTVQTSLGPITVDVPRDRNGEYKPIAIPRYQRRTDLITSTVLKLYSSGMTGDEMRLAISSIYEAHCSRSTISSITDAVAEDVERFAKRKLPNRLFAVFLDSTYVPLRRDTVAKEAINVALGITDDGTPLFIGFSIAPCESAEAYRDLLADFKSRGSRRWRWPRPTASKASTRRYPRRIRRRKGRGASSICSGTYARGRGRRTGGRSPTRSWA